MLFQDKVLADGLINNEVYSLAIDAQGNKWFGIGYGVSKLSDDIATGIDPLLNQNDLSLYPNPTRGKFSVSSSNSIYSIEIYNLLGDRIYTDFKSQQSTPKEIDLSNTPKGVYVVKIFNGKEEYIRKVLIQ